MRLGKDTVMSQKYRRLTNNLQIGQFIESIYPSQDPKALASIQAATSKQSVSKNTESKEDVIYLIIAVLGTLFVVSLLMVIPPY